VTADTSICINAPAFNWNGQTISAAGTYSYTTTSANGCDSTIILTVNSSNTITVTADTSICINAPAFNWNGQTISAAGTYSYTTTSVNGCDSTIVLTVNSSNTITVTADTIICINAPAFNWNGQTISAAGTYSYTTTSVNGCDSTIILTVNSSNTITVTADSSICINAPAFNWNGQTISAAGTYSYTTLGANGCDSTIILTVNSSNTITVTADTTVCINTPAFNWNGQTISAAGTYSYTTTSANGCDSTIILTVNNSNTITVTADTSICINAPAFNWNGQTISAAGTYSYTTTSANGCDSTIILRISIAAISTSNDTIILCENQLPIIWNGYTLTASGTYNHLLNNAAGCDSTANLIMIVNPISKGADTMKICSNQLPFTWNGTTYTASGSSIETLTNSINCDSIVTHTLIIADTIVTTEYKSLCSNDLPYNWNGISINSQGVYRDTLLNQFGCDSISILVVDVYNVSSFTDSAIVCKDKLPYRWNGLLLYQDSTYQIVFNRLQGCDSIANLVLKVYDSASLKIDNPVAVCQPDRVDLTDSLITSGSDSNLTFTYWMNAGLTIPLTDPTSVSTGTYFIKGTNNYGCFMAEAVSVIVNNKPLAILSGDTSICEGSTATLNVNLIGVAPFTITYTDGDSTRTISGINSNNYQFNVNADSTLTIKIISVQDAVCLNIADSTSATINVFNTVSGIRYPDLKTQPFVPLQLNARNLGDYIVDWNPRFGLSSYSILNPVFNYDISMDYTITYSNNSGCNVVDSQRVIILETDSSQQIKSGIWVPKAWSPNNSGKNDKLRPLCLNIRQIKFFRIFNRWGELVFETNQFGAGWNGIYKGKQQVSDVYTWTLEAYGVDGKRFFMSGNSILLR
jgi:gliding motility-associated-like protein